MKTAAWICILFVSFILVPTVSPGQESTADIFADMNDFQPTAVIPTNTAPAAEVPPATLAMPQPAPAPQPKPLTVQMPEETPAIISPSEPAMLKAEEPAAGPVDAEAYVERGKDAYHDGDLDAAQQYFEAILFDDAYNSDAIRWLRKIADKKAGRENKSYDATRSRMLGEVQAAWNTPKAKGKQADDTGTARELSESEQRSAALRAKLELIRIPAITFQNADIQQVILELSALCRKLDPETKGVNLVAFGTSETLLPPVTFSGTDLSALETLDIVTQMSGMKYDIGPNMVSLTPVNYEPPQQMVSTEFDIMPSVGSKMMVRAGANGLDGGSLVDVREFFSTVPFPPGASAQYNPEFNVLLVRNVPKHLDKISELLDRYDRKAQEERARQVEIETKFIEVAQGTLDELGFNWTVGDASGYVNNDTIALAGGNLFTETFRSGLDAFSSAVSAAGTPASFSSYGTAVSDSINSGLAGTPGKILIQKTTGTPVDLTIKALERSSGSDLLSAPKILTKSGETASIHVGEIHWYPTAYDVVIERYSQPSLVPLDYEEQKTGVMLEVTPELDPENGTIGLKLAPEIRELAGFDEQHAATVWPDFGDEQLNIGTTTATSESTPSLFEFLTDREKNRTVNADRLIARQPIFKTRKMETSVTIEDGSTIVLGGLIKEQLETFKDSVPILGKIPLIGRLFRSEGEKSVKRNLLIFVTANQVDATGYKKSTK